MNTHSIRGRWHNRLKDEAISLIFLRLILGVVSKISAVAMSVIRPDTDIEKAIAVWPISLPFRQWFYRVWFAPLDRWDATLYAAIIIRGYRQGEGLVQFHPLYPLVSRAFNLLGFSPIASLQLVSFAASIAFLLVFLELVACDMSRASALRAVVLFLFSPFSFATFIPYSESLFFLCSAAALLFARKQRWWLAGLMGGLATLTRQQGVFLLVPLAWELFEVYERSIKASLRAFSLRFRQENHGIGYALCLIPMAYAGWISYRAIAVSDLVPDFSSINALIYSVLISPNASQVVHDQAFVAPWTAIGVAIHKLITAPDADIYINLIWGIYFMSLVVISWPKLRISYKLYTAIIILVSWMYTTGDVHPYMGLVRHLTLAFPIFTTLERELRKPFQRKLVFIIGTTGLISTIMFYVMHVWVP